MTISKDLYLAILSMDAYNRSYGAGIAGLGGVNSAIGAATLLTDSETEFGDPLAPQGALSPAATVGFYAVAYTMGADAPQGLAGKTVISYRGTDNFARFVDPFAGVAKIGRRKLHDPPVTSLVRSLCMCGGSRGCPGGPAQDRNRRSAA